MPTQPLSAFLVYGSLRAGSAASLSMSANSTFLNLSASVYTAGPVNEAGAIGFCMPAGLLSRVSWK
jgi:hypothetical protein